MEVEAAAMDFKISVEETGEVERNISIEIPRDIYQQRFELAIRKASQQARIKGFRPGKAPKAIIDKLYGQQIHSDVLGELVSSAYQDAVQQHELKVVGYPEINIDGSRENAEEDFKVTAGVSVFPEPEIKDYFGLSFDVEVEPFTQEMVDQHIEQMKGAYASIEPISKRKTAKDKDLVMVDFEGTIDDEPFEGSTASDIYIEIGGKAYPAELESSIVGMKVGEEKQVDVTFTGEDNEELSGKTASYKVNLKGIYERVLPEVDDEFAKKVGIGETAEELLEKVGEMMQKDLERRNRSLREEQYFKTLLEKNSFEVPQAMCDEEIRNFLYQMGLLDPSNPQSQQFDVSAFRDTMAEQAEFRVRQAVALSRIMESEKMTSCDEKEVEAWLEQRAVDEGRSRDELDRVYGFPAQLSRLQSMVAREKMLDQLLEKSKIKEVKKKPEAEDAKES